MYDDRYLCGRKGIPFVAFSEAFDFEKNTFRHKPVLIENGRRIFTHLHCHGDFEILCITEGKADMQVGEIRRKVGRGDVVLVCPYVTHFGSIPDSVKRFSYLCIDFDLSFLDDGSACTSFVGDVFGGRKSFFPFVKDADGLCTETIRQAESAYRTAPNGWELLVKGALYRLFAGFVADSLITESAPTVPDPFVRDVCAYIEAHYAQPITSQSASAALGYNQSYFCRRFRQAFSCSFGEYLTHFRIKKACTAFQTENGTVSRIAFSCGFENMSYFSKVFRARTGFTPTAYASRVRKTD